MTDTLATWLITDAPASRRQAVIGNLYRGAVAILRNPTALVGLIIVALLVLTAIFAPWLSAQSPIAQDLAGWRWTSVGMAHRSTRFLTDWTK